MAAGHDQGRDGRGGEGRADGVAALPDGDAAVPAAPDAGRGEHASAAAHVAEGALPRAVGAAACDAGNPGHGTARAPGLGRVVHAGVAVDGVGLAFVLAHVGVDEVDHVGANGGREDDGEGGLPLAFAGCVEDGDLRACGHGFSGVSCMLMCVGLGSLCGGHQSSAECPCAHE